MEYVLLLGWCIFFKCESLLPCFRFCRNLAYSGTVHFQNLMLAKKFFPKVFHFVIGFQFFTYMNSTDIRANFLYNLVILT